MKHWTKKQEAEKLAERFKGRNQAAFAREFNVPGGASMVSQHIKGRRPLNMEAALAYMKGFGVPLHEISPRLAEQMYTALREIDEKPTQAPVDQLPYLVSMLAEIQQLDPQRFERLVSNTEDLLRAMRETDQMLRVTHGVTGYVTPARAKERLAKVKIKPSAPSEGGLQGGLISGFGGLDEASEGSS